MTTARVCRAGLLVGVCACVLLGCVLDPAGSFSASLGCTGTAHAPLVLAPQPPYLSPAAHQCRQYTGYDPAKDGNPVQHQDHCFNTFYQSTAQEVRRQRRGRIMNLEAASS